MEGISFNEVTSWPFHAHWTKFFRVRTPRHLQFTTHCSSVCYHNGTINCYWKKLVNQNTLQNLQYIKWLFGYLILYWLRVLVFSFHMKSESICNVFLVRSNFFTWTLCKKFPEYIIKYVTPKYPEYIRKFHK